MSGAPERIYMRDIDGTGGMHPCWRDDPGAISYTMTEITEEALVAKDSEIARLRGLMREAEELTDAAIDPRYGSREDWDWREDVLSRIGAELAADVKE